MDYSLKCRIWKCLKEKYANEITDSNNEDVINFKNGHSFKKSEIDVCYRVWSRIYDRFDEIMDMYLDKGISNTNIAILKKDSKLIEFEKEGYIIMKNEVIMKKIEEFCLMIVNDRLNY